MPYVLTASSSPSFALKGMAGFEFEALQDQDFAVHLLDVHRGHDTFMISKALTRLYYILEGNGVFTIESQRYDVAPGQLVEVPPGVEYSYSGTMKVFLVSHPRWFEGNERTTRNNPDVVSEGRLLWLIKNKLRRYRSLLLIRNRFRRYRSLLAVYISGRRSTVIRRHYEGTS